MNMDSDIEYIPPKGFDDFLQWLRSWSPGVKKAALLYGPPGVGKTRMIIEACKRLGLERVYVPQGMSFEEVLWLSRTPGRRLLHLDRPFLELGLSGRQLREIVRASRHPVVIEDEDNKYYSFLGAFELRVEPPAKHRIAAAMGGGGIDYSRIGRDMRQALMLAYGGMGYSSESWLDRLVAYLRTGRAGGLEKSHLPAILDSIVSSCYGTECYELLSLLAAVDYSGRIDALEGHRPRRPLSKPSMYFYEKVRMLEQD